MATSISIVSRDSSPGDGNEIEEIVSKKPPFVVMWGTVFFLVFLVVIAVVCWFVRYPDIVVASARLNSVNAPREVVTRTDGRLARLVVKEGEKVGGGQLLGYMESIAEPGSVMRVDARIDSVISLIAHNRTDEIVRYFPHDLAPGSGVALGELQSSYQKFVQAFGTFRDFLKDGFYLQKKKMLLTDETDIENLHSILVSQRELLQQDLSLSSETFTSSESLLKEKVISPSDYRTEKSKLISKQLTLPQINASIVGNESQLNGKRKEIAELENQIVVQKNTFIQAVQTLKSEIQAWQYKYLLRAPVAGSVSFTGFIQENQEMKSSQPVFYVQPDSTSYFMEMLVPQYNFGKVREGQKVLIRFRAYPFEQYGSVAGRIASINRTATDSGYLARVILPDGLVTSYRQPLAYRNGLVAEAEIVTEDLRLLERFYYGVAKRVKR